jgi:hypothetical protein
LFIPCGTGVRTAVLSLTFYWWVVKVSQEHERNLRTDTPGHAVCSHTREEVT